MGVDPGVVGSCSFFLSFDSKQIFFVCFFLLEFNLLPRNMKLPKVFGFDA